MSRRCNIILSNKCYALVIVVYTCVIVIFHYYIVPVVFTSIRNRKYIKNHFSDDSSDTILHQQSCQSPPIDAVYTWVNGSDPLFIRQLNSEKKRLMKETSRKCPFSDCVPSHFTAFKKSPKELNAILNKLSIDKFDSVTRKDSNWTILTWNTIEIAEAQADITFHLNHQSILPLHVYWTTDKSALGFYLLKNALAIKGDETVESLSKEVLEEYMGYSISRVWRYSKIIYAELYSDEDVQQILKGKSSKILSCRDQSQLLVTHAGLILNMPWPEHSDVSLPNRFEDKEELRYSLRSLEKFAPWIRKVFIVTNGQVPYWLNMSNPRVELITHDCIFLNSSHLPTFSSPAIESHLHRIPGISDDFLYFNDDIFLGREVFPEDFISSEEGLKVYLAWDAPLCSDHCWWGQLGNGICDRKCNVSACNFDGLDCLPKNGKPADQLMMDMITQALFDRSSFGGSLIYVNFLLNKRYGYSPRRVPHHMPHMINKHIMSNLQRVFPDEFEKTSSHVFRHPQDMQYMFSYLYYVMSEKVGVSCPEMFDFFDKDGSGTWSDKEILTVLSLVFDEPYTVLDFKTSLVNCTKNINVDSAHTTRTFEEIIDFELPLLRPVLRKLVEKCSSLCDLLKHKIGGKINRYLSKEVPAIIKDYSVEFNQIRSNVTVTKAVLNMIRRRMRKFICLNNDMDSSKEEANQIIRDELSNFYNSLFPHPSQFELPTNQSNDYRYYSEFVTWQNKMHMLTVMLHTAFSVALLLILFYLCNFVSRNSQHRLRRRSLRIFTGEE